ncbi:MAG TPA: GNAT family N-acetyltransferase [Abditibacteriaceae bacterium]|jgi:ribosomal protein S18 acetylase RimI-like enzyme
MDFCRVERANLTECVALFADVFNNSPWNETWGAEAIAQRFSDCYHTPGFYGLVATISDEAVGFAIGYIEQWNTTKHFYLKEMCVAPKQQRFGIGTALMSALENNLKNQNVEKLYLHTARDTYAQTFYEKQGFYVSSKMITMTKWLKSD